MARPKKQKEENIVVVEKFEAPFEFLNEYIDDNDTSDLIKTVQRLLHVKQTGIIDETTLKSFDQLDDKNNFVADFKNLF